MFDINHYHSFLLAIIIFQLIPGPGTVAIIKATASGGVKSGLCAVCGTLLGDIVYMTSAVLGLATILEKFPWILRFAQYLGIFYLCYLGGQKLLERVAGSSKVNMEEMAGFQNFKQAFFVCLTNPKAIMFFMAFFPLFLTKNSQSFTLVVMMLHVTIISSIYQILLVFMSYAVSKKIIEWKYSKLIATRLAGVAFLVFGIRLAIDI